MWRSDGYQGDSRYYFQQTDLTINLSNPLYQSVLSAYDISPPEPAELGSAPTLQNQRVLEHTSFLLPAARSQPLFHKPLSLYPAWHPVHHPCPIDRHLPPGGPKRTTRRNLSGHGLALPRTGFFACRALWIRLPLDRHLLIILGQHGM